MKEQDKKLLHEIQKNAQMAVDSIEEVSDKVYDDEFMQTIREHGRKFNEYERKALIQMGRQGISPYKEKPMEKVMLKSGIMANTMMDVSTGHLAEMMIQGNNRGITDLCKAMNHSPEAADYAMELAKELMDFEEKAIEELKQYL